MMKQKILLLLFSLPLLTFAQNWQPLISHSKYLYSSEDHSLPKNAVWITGAMAIGSDSIFILNKIGQPSFSYMNIVGGFLQDTVIKKAQGIYLFNGKEGFSLHTQAYIGEIWAWNATTTAQAYLKTLGNVLGIADSLLYISLSSGDTVILSQNYGIIEFPKSSHFTYKHYLMGIPDRNVGTDVPHLLDFYDWEVGDLFQYIYDFSWSNGYDVFESEIDTFFWEIIGVNVIIPDSLVTIDIHEYKKGKKNSNKGSVEINETLICVDKIFTMSLAYDFLNIDNDYPDHIHQTSYFDYDSNSILTKSLYNYSPGRKATYKIGLGKTDTYINQQIAAGGSTEKQTLIGYQKKGQDVVGILTPLYFSANTPSLIHVFPNPAYTSLSIEGVNQGEYWLCDIEGKIKTKGNLASSQQIDVGEYQAGIYILKIWDDDKQLTFTQKVVVLK